MDTNLSNTTTTNLDNSSLSYTAPHATIDEEGAQDETYWDNTYWSEGLGLFKNIPEYKEPIRALARWAVGKGYTADNRTSVLLDNITGGGEDSFQSIMTNHIIVKKTNGDAFAEIVRNDNGTLINLKPLSPSNIKVVWNRKGIIERYEEINPKGKTIRKFRPQDIFHSMNDRIANEIHGTPAWEACKDELEMKKEAQNSWRKIIRRSTIRIIYVDMDDPTKLSRVKSEWQTAIKQGEAMLLPGKKGQDFEVADYDVPPIDPYIRWIEYLDRRIYQSLGIPKAIADTADFTEAASKVGYMTFEPVYTEEQTLLEQDLWNQLAIKVTFNRPPSLTSTMQDSETKNTGQTSIQPNETQVAPQRTE